MECLLDLPIALIESELDLVSGGGGNIIYNIHVTNNGSHDGNGDGNRSGNAYGHSIDHGSANGDTNGNLNGNVTISIS
jgi:hypothetical protein